MRTDSSVVFEFVNRIFLDYSPMYHQIKKIAERDIGQELLDKIKEFLEKRKKEGIKEAKIEKFVFEDPSTVPDEGINDIIDAFVRMRSISTLNQVDKGSINDILILFNQWITIGKSHPTSIPIEAFTLPENRPSQSLEEQIMHLEPSFIRDSPLYPSSSDKKVYTAMSDIYGTLGMDAGSSGDSNPFYHVSEYKMQRQSNL